MWWNTFVSFTPHTLSERMNRELNNILHGCNMNTLLFFFFLPKSNSFIAVHVHEYGLFRIHSSVLFRNAGSF